MTIYAFDMTRTSNAQAIFDARQLGYINASDHVADVTYGYGSFWTLWRPDDLTACDIELAKSPIGYSVDFRSMPFEDASFDVVVFDPPYKLSGTTDTHTIGDGFEERFGIVTQNYKVVPELYAKGLVECVRVLRPKGRLLVKSQAQVSSGIKHWQPYDALEMVRPHGLRLIDELHVFGVRDQPTGTRQVHASTNYSTLSILGRGIHKGRPA